MTNSELHEYLKKNFHHTSSLYMGIITVLSDFIALFASIAIGFFLVNLVVTNDIHFKSFINYSIYIPLFILVFAAAGLYPGIMIPPTEQIKKSFLCTLFGFSGICCSIIMISIKDIILAKEFFITYSSDTALCCALILAIPFATLLITSFRELFKHLLFKKSWIAIPAVIYCGGESSRSIIDRLLKSPYLGYVPAVIISEDQTLKDLYPTIPFFSSDSEIYDVIKAHNIKVALLCDYDPSLGAILFTKYRYTLSFSKQMPLSNSMQIKDMAGIMGFSSTNKLSFSTNLFIKRFSELFIIIVASPLWLPITLITWILVKLTSPGPGIYRHKRVGKDGKELWCLKFRSMYRNSDEMLVKLLAENADMREQWEKDRKLVNDPRITPFGKILRKTSLDELPQLFNVLLGNMSLIGPRPVTESELKYYGNYADFVFSVKPGISGMWQVSGRSDTGYEERVNFDTYYIQNWSPWLDVWILIKTVWVVISHKGAY